MQHGPARMERRQVQHHKLAERYIYTGTPSVVTTPKSATSVVSTAPVSGKFGLLARLCRPLYALPGRGTQTAHLLLLLSPPHALIEHIESIWELLSENATSTWCL